MKKSDAINGFQKRIDAIEKLESELTRKASQIIEGVDKHMFTADFFLFGATSRTLAQSKGFRELIQAKNFPCAAAILRMQIDTAMRVNGLRYVGSINDFCKQLMDGKQFDQLKDQNGNKLTDFYLKKRLSEEYPWVQSVYREASDLVHLSMKHLWTSIVDTDDETKTARFVLGAVDPPRPEEDYYEILEAFFEASKLASVMIISCLTAIHSKTGSPSI